MSETIYIINTVEYTKQQIEDDTELKKIYYHQLRKEARRIASCISQKKYRQEHKDKIKEYNKTYQLKKYNSDPEYKKKRLEQQREYTEKKNLYTSFPKLPVGRPSKYALDDELNLICS